MPWGVVLDSKMDFHTDEIRASKKESHSLALYPDYSYFHECDKVQVLQQARTCAREDQVRRSEISDYQLSPRPLTHVSG